MSFSASSANLDLLRAVAVVLVVLSHLPPLSLAVDERWYHLHSLGVLGVCIFFVHTCFVLMLSMQRTGGLHVGPFLVRRAFRIYPLSVAVVLLMHWRNGTMSAATTVSNLLLVQNLTGHESLPAPLWSLPYEVQMYLVLPLLFGVGVRPLFLLWAAAAGVAVGASLFGLGYHLIAYVPCFLAGVLAFARSDEPRTRSPLALFGYVGMLALVFPVLTALGGWEEASAWLVCLGLGVFIPRCRELTSPALTAAARVIARYSYGIYLLHTLCVEIAFVRLADRPALVQWPVFLCLLAALAFVTHHAIEKPGIALGARLAGMGPPHGNDGE